MRVLVTDDVHVFELKDGSFWTDAINGYDFYKRYLDVFDHVTLVGRTQVVDSLPSKVLRIDGPGIDVFPIPFFQGPKGLFKKFLSVNKHLKSVFDNIDVAVFRMPSVTSFLTIKKMKKNIPYGLEIVYDPYDDINNKKAGFFYRLMWRYMNRLMKKYCMRANGVSYVTKQSIQRHIPCYSIIHGESDYHFSTHYSSIALKDDAFSSDYKQFNGNKKCVLAISDVAMNNDRKGESVLIRVVAKCRDKGYDVSAILIGDGSLKPKYEEMCNQLNIKEYVRFTGLLPSSDLVREKMKSANVFLYPTKAEGLPRGVIEAMAMGLPVLSTPVGGIPELIDSKYLFDPYNVDGFAEELCRLLDNPKELEEMSKRNLELSKQYRNDYLQEKRNIFYSKLKALAQR